MKKFVFRIGYFVFVVTIFLVSIILSIYLLLNKSSVYQLDSSVKHIIVGDSHTQCAIDDVYLAHTINISNSADSYLYTYIKLKKLLIHNTHIQSVILSYSGLNLSVSMEDWNFHNVNIKSKTSQYFSLMGAEEFNLFLARNPKSFIEGVLQFPKMKMNVVRTFSSNTSIMNIGVGGVERLSVQIKDWKVPALVQNEVNDSKLSESQITYLNKIISLCLANRVKLILIATPLHATYPRQSENQAISYHDRYMNEISWWNYSNLVLPDSCYSDYIHLNIHGAKYFSSLLQSRINDEF